MFFPFFFLFCGKNFTKFQHEKNDFNCKPYLCERLIIDVQAPTKFYSEESKYLGFTFLKRSKEDLLHIQMATVHWSYNAGNYIISNLGMCVSRWTHNWFPNQTCNEIFLKIQKLLKSLMNMRNWAPNWESNQTTSTL